MDIATDLVDIKEFERSIKRSGKLFLEKVFIKRELEDKRLEHLAGIFCVKECAVKVGLIKPGQWLEVEVKNNHSGKPYLFRSSGKRYKNITISISHTNTLCIAVLLKY